MSDFAVGSLVRCRGREWVVLPSDDSDLLKLRPLGGSESEICGIYKPLGLDKIEQATFDPPDPDRPGDFVSVQLLLDAARLSLRTGAGPFRCLGRISVRPRPYQTVPLLLGLRSDPVRLLIADDVGIGKTIEGALIARELLDRAEVRRMAVLCPPHLCDQWRKELAEKFHIDAVVVRTGTAARHERAIPHGDISLYEYYPHLVVSIDYVKSDRRRAAFLLHCPDLVMVDEAHTATRPGGVRGSQQQQRHELVRELAAKPERHLILLTATPHSGIEGSFNSLIGLLNREFELLDLNQLDEKDRDKLARHFIQRRRADVRHWLGEDTPFPDRESSEEAYSLSPEYQRLFSSVYDFAREIVRTGESLTASHRRVRYWAALALLRCVMSSPAAAEVSLTKRAKQAPGGPPDEEIDEELFADSVYDRTETEVAVDAQPTHVVEQGEATLEESDLRKLRDFARRSRALRGELDPKIKKAAAIVDSLLKEGFAPIVYCRFIATSDYVAEELNRRLSHHSGLRIISATGAQSEDERELRVRELTASPERVLVCTDCLSEGVNLQEDFSAVVHYDLPWNPNRLEQREGRVDRFGQPKKVVKAVLLYGRDNPIDGAVLNVLIRKAVEIHRSLGVSVPVPVNNEEILKAVFEHLFLKQTDAGQLRLFEEPVVTAYHQALDRSAEREKESRTRFAQRAIKPDEVTRELEETDAVLGDRGSVERFVRAACERLHAPLHRSADGWAIDVEALPQIVSERLPKLGPISFASPPPEGFETIGRNHTLTASLAEYLLDSAFDASERTPPASRCGVLRTAAVEKRTTFLLLRIRFSLGGNLLAEEALPFGFTGRPGQLEPLDETATVELFSHAESLMKQPGSTFNVTPEERQRTLDAALDMLANLPLEEVAQERAQRLLDAHRRVRRLTAEKLRGFRVEPYPPDVLGLYVLLPIPEGVAQ